MIDNTWTAAATALAARGNTAASTARLLTGAAAVARTTAMLTNYEGGTIRVLPVKAHLALDAALCSVLIASPLFLPASERRYAVIPVMLGIAGLVASLLTETGSRAEDPDIAAHPHLRPHLE
jgi:hypothetical protein